MREDYDLDKSKRELAFKAVSGFRSIGSRCTGTEVSADRNIQPRGMDFKELDKTYMNFSYIKLYQTFMRNSNAFSLL